ncbi:MAG: L-aspartate oxidase [Elusimicrobia bacterium]|nr:L-aspartate oxidase [Elusimicrobiota bacterium]
MNHECDFLVLGSGLAGLLSALKLAGLGRVVVATKKDAAESNTNHAQGGIAAVTSPTDSVESHAADTLAAGAGLCDESIVRIVVREAPERIKELMQLGVRFTHRKGAKSGAGLDLGLEAGHAHRRVLHAGDITGQELERAVLLRCREHPRIRIVEDHLAVDLICRPDGGRDRCQGAYVMDARTRRIDSWSAKATVLATGGAGKVYLYTSNPDIASGDGMAMAYRAGAAMANMEFVQFHPTCLYHPQAKSFLLSEALRGEGGRLVLKNGAAFMAKYTPMKELAPRDIVARAIDAELKRTGDDCVYLDMTHQSRDFLKTRFPNIYEKLLGWGIDMAVEPIPAVPAAHYFCGGVRTDEHGATTVPGLYAAGEVACTGLHGANRLASNSLLEGCVFAHRIGLELRERWPALKKLRLRPPKAWNPGKAVPLDEAVVISQNWDEIRRLMWNYVAIVRSDRRLDRALHRMWLLNAEIDQYYWDFILTPDLVELRNLAVVATLVISSARKRKESRGLHYNLDYPKTLPAQRRDTVITCPQITRPPHGGADAVSSGSSL